MVSASQCLFLGLALGLVNHGIRDERDPFCGDRHLHERVLEEPLELNGVLVGLSIVSSVHDDGHDDAVSHDPSSGMLGIPHPCGAACWIGGGTFAGGGGSCCCGAGGGVTTACGASTTATYPGGGRYPSVTMT